MMTEEILNYVLSHTSVIPAFVAGWFARTIWGRFQFARYSFGRVFRWLKP